MAPAARFMPPSRFSGNLGRVTLRFDKCRMLCVTPIPQCVFYNILRSYQEPGLDFDIFSAADSKIDSANAVAGAAAAQDTEEQRNERY